MAGEEDQAPAQKEELAAPERAPEKKRASRAGLIFRALGWLIVALFYGSLVWVGAYRFVDPPTTLTMLERRLGGAAVDRRLKPLAEISPYLVRAVIAAEDSRFCLHQGIDFAAVQDALDEKRNGGRRRGASTITQQTAKNAFLWNGGGWVRKGAEAWFTVLADLLWTKRRTMEVYLNLAEWGDGLFGAEAAAQARFSKSARRLTAGEAALLAAVLPSPNKWRVDPPGPYVKGRAAMLRLRMEQIRRDGLDSCVVRR
jgi:monofunctional biosynthetic peptidoglycan transglycosylase